MAEKDPQHQSQPGNGRSKEAFDDELITDHPSFLSHVNEQYRNNLQRLKKMGHVPAGKQQDMTQTLSPYSIEQEEHLGQYSNELY